ncbi:MAG: alpha/beta hydrolase [Gammaproteobacteria bacterium]|nr:MAG: alpha/beta hydrolase [Gammaproteobacteria bacterium]
MQKVLDALASLNGKPIEDLDPGEARIQPTPADAVKKLLQDSGKSTAPDASISVKEISIPGPFSPIPAYTFTPEGKGPFPVLIYYHGGGFVIANTKTYEASARALAKGAKAVVVSVDYRQAPENKFPAATDDAFAAYKWTLDHAKDINGDAKHIAVGGESAGANLATVVSLMARDKKVQLPVHQLLVYPVVSDDMSSPSYKLNEDAKPLNKDMMKWFFKYYAADPKNPYALPIKTDSLKGLPSATIITAEIDPLLSEGKAYADRLKVEGVNVDYREYKGVTHEFFGMGAVVKKAKDAEDFASANLKKAFAK